MFSGFDYNMVTYENDDVSERRQKEMRHQRENEALYIYCLNQTYTQYGQMYVDTYFIYLS